MWCVCTATCDANHAYKVPDVYEAYDVYVAYNVYEAHETLTIFRTSISV